MTPHSTMNTALKVARRSSAVAGALIAALAAVFAMSLPAHAASDYTPNGGPEANFVGSNVAFTVDSTGQELDCPTFNLLGEVINPGVSRAFGESAGVLDQLEAIGCTNPLAGDTDVTPYGDWKIAVTGAETGSESPVTLSDIKVTVNALSGACTFDVVGSLDGIFDDSTQVFTPTVSNLEVASSPAPSGFLCNVLGVAPGVHVSIDANTFWTNTPPAGNTDLDITNP